MRVIRNETYNWLVSVRLDLEESDTESRLRANAMRFSNVDEHTREFALRWS